MSLTWSNSWIQYYESSWCTINKFAYANELIWKEFFNLLNISTRYTDYTTSYYQTLVKQLEHIGVHSSDHHIYFLNKLLGKLYNNDNLNKYFNPFLTYCPICIQKGYHAWFHQIVFVDICPIHNRKLRYTCPSCNGVINMDLNQIKAIPPFTCSCGHSLIDKDNYRSLIDAWSKPIKVSESEPLISSLLTNSDHTYYYQYRITRSSETLRLLNLSSLMQQPYVISHIITLNKVNSSYSKLIANKNLCNLPTISQQEHLFQLVEYYIAAIKCTAKVIRRSCKNISTCIKLFKTKRKQEFYSLNKSIPTSNIKCTQNIILAYAYIMWRRDVEGHETFESVHVNLKLESHSCKFTSLHEHILRSELFKYFWNVLEEVDTTFTDKNQYTKFNYTMMSLMYDMLLCHYKSWLSYACKKFTDINNINIIDLYDNIPYDFPFYFSYDYNDLFIVSKINKKERRDL